MAKRTTLEDDLAAIRAARGDPRSAPSLAVLRAALEGTRSFAVAAAADAVGAAGRADGIPLLRYKALVGDADPQVLTECFAALLALAPSDSLAFVAPFLRHGDEAVSESAALALGQSRLEGAFPIL